MSSATDEAAPAIVRDEPAVEDPTDLTRDDYKVALARTKVAIKRDDVPSLAAGVAFKIFLALFPALLAAVAIFSLVTDPAQLDEYLALLAGVVPGDALSILETALQNVVETETGASLGLLVTGVGAGLFSASSAAATLVKALNRAYEVSERSFVKQRLVSLAITLALLGTILALIVLVIAGPQVRGLLIPEQLDSTAVTVAFGIGQVLLVLALLVLLFAFIYWIGPNREQRSWVWMSPGALVGVVGWLVLSLGFTLYVQNFGDYDATYGALGGVIVLLLWLQLTMAILLIGAELNAEVERLKAQREDVRDGVGMGHASEALEVEDQLRAAALLPPGIAPSAARPARTAFAAPETPPSATGGTGAIETNGSAPTGSRPTALIAGAAAAAAVAAAVGLRRRST